MTITNFSEIKHRIRIFTLKLIEVVEHARNYPMEFIA
jgi:hypothetical protein